MDIERTMEEFIEILEKHIQTLFNFRTVYTEKIESLCGHGGPGGYGYFNNYCLHCCTIDTNYHFSFCLYSEDDFVENRKEILKVLVNRFAREYYEVLLEKELI